MSMVQINLFTLHKLLVFIFEEEMPIREIFFTT